MISGKKILALIPARANSVELPKKNLKIFDKKPLIQWTLDAVTKSKYIDKVIISSDSNKILKIASKYKNFDLNYRPKKLAKSTSKIIDLIRYEVNRYRNFDILILLQPTSPLRTHRHIDQSIKNMIKQSKESCVSFIHSKFNPHNFFSINKKLRIRKITKHKLLSSNRQENENYYYPSGDIYISYIYRLKSKKSFIDKDTYPFLIKRNFFSDIDNIFDFKIAEFTKKN